MSDDDGFRFCVYELVAAWSSASSRGIGCS